MSRTIETLHVATAGLVHRTGLAIATRGWVLPGLFPPPPPPPVLIFSPIFLEGAYDYRTDLMGEYDWDP